MEAFLEVLFKYMDPIAAIIAVGFTQLIRYFLPAPEGGGKFDVNDKIYRFLPISPILWAMLVVFFRLVWIDSNPLPIESSWTAILSITKRLSNRRLSTARYYTKKRSRFISHISRTMNKQVSL